MKWTDAQIKVGAKALHDIRMSRYENDGLPTRKFEESSDEQMQVLLDEVKAVLNVV